MRNIVVILSVLTAAFAVLTIRAYLNSNLTQKVIFKPLTMVCIIAIAFLQTSDMPYYKTAILIGLFFSLAGDMFLIWDKKLFLPGLIAFLLAHVCYTFAFYETPRLPNSIYSAIPFLIVFVIFVSILWRRLGPMKVPVIVYALTICAMGRFAMLRWLDHGTTDMLLAFAGASIFIVSDILLGYDRFRQPIPTKDIYVLGTYFLAQWLIAMSI
jgi:uncharacterized membrane protein YhhN